jgi:carbamoyltransferase
MTLPRLASFGGVTGPQYLGISADYHDAAAALVTGSRPVGAALEERFTRRKHDPSLPAETVRWLLGAAGTGPEDLAAVAFYAKPLTTLERVLLGHARAGLRGTASLARALTTWGRTKVWLEYRIERLLRSLGYPLPRMLYAEHHQSHAAAAFFPSPFETAAILTFDGVGEWATSTVGRGRGHRIDLNEELRFPDSLGLWYSAMTTFCGFAANDGEYKLMGLSPYGRPRYEQVLRDHVVQVFDDGSIRLDLRWFRFLAGNAMTHPRLARLLDGPPRPLDGPLGQREADIAASAQAILEDAILKAARHARQRTGEHSVCLAGGVALNCVANRRLREDGPFDNVWVQPAAGDDGGALGAAMWAAHQVDGLPRTPVSPDAMAGALLGPAYDPASISPWLRDLGIDHRDLGDGELTEEVAELLAAGAVVGWFRGRMEFGPRALGARSILADPRDPDAIHRLNQRVKGREGFRPFAPCVVAEDAARWFDLEHPSPYMLFTTHVRDAQLEPVVVPDGSFAQRLGRRRSPIPACTHVDGSARVQTVDHALHPDLHRLLRRVEVRTGIPILLNTSFNVRDEPIVASPLDALQCYERASLDALVIEGCLIERLDR